MGDEYVIRKYPLICMCVDKMCICGNTGQIYGTQFGTIDIKIRAKLRDIEKNDGVHYYNTYCVYLLAHLPKHEFSKFSTNTKLCKKTRREIRGKSECVRLRKEGNERDNMLQRSKLEKVKYRDTQYLFDFPPA